MPDPNEEKVKGCNRFLGGDGYWVCDRCGSMWSSLLHGVGWLPLSCPDRAALSSGDRK